MSDDRKQKASNGSQDAKEEEEEEMPSSHKNETSQKRISDHEAMMNEKRRVQQQSRGNHAMHREPMARKNLSLATNHKTAGTTLSGELMHALTEEMSLRKAQANKSSSEHETVLQDRLEKLMQYYDATDPTLKVTTQGDALSHSLLEEINNVRKPSANLESLRCSETETAIASSSKVETTTDGKLSAHEIMMLEKTRVKNEMARGLRKKIEEDQTKKIMSAKTGSASTISSVDDSYGTSSESVMMRAKNRERAHRVAALGVASRQGVARASRDYSSAHLSATSVHSSSHSTTMEQDKKLKAALKTASPIETSTAKSVATAPAQATSSFPDIIDEKARGRASRVAAASVASRPGVSWVDHPSQSNSQRYSQSSMDSSSRAASIGSDDDTVTKQRIRASLLPTTAPVARVGNQESMADDHDRMLMEKRAVAGQLYDWARGNNREVDTASEPSIPGSSTTPGSFHSGASSRSASTPNGQDVESRGSVVGSEGNLFQNKGSHLGDGREEQMELDMTDRGASPGEVFTSSSTVISGQEYGVPNSARDLQSCDEDSVHSVHSNPEIEAQVGLPVIFPGAFAITGMDHENDDGYVSAGIQSVATDYNIEEQLLYEDPEEQVFENELVEISALEATLAEAAVTVEGAVIQNDDEYDLKTLRRVRTMQYGICMFAVCAVALVTLSVIGRLSSATGEKPIPTVEGWAIVGATVVGPIDEAGTQFGRALDMTQDGKKVAVVAPGSDDGMLNNVGALYFFQEKEGPNGTEWELLTTNLKGPGEQSSTFASLAMSTDLVYIAVAYPDYENGAVMIYKENQATNEIDFEVRLASNTTESTWFGYAVDLSDDGNILAIGAPRSNSKNTAQVGAVHVFQRNGTQWVQLGEPIVGEVQDEFSGWSVTVANSNGIRVAIGSPVIADFTGRVRVLDWTGTSWKQAGESSEGEGQLNRFGDSLDFSHDGKVLAVGARGTFYESPGYVAIFEEVNGDWILKGDLIRGQTEGEGFGADIALSEDGNVVAIGAPSNDDFGEGSGSIRVFEFDETLGSWEQVGSPIGGQPRGEYGSSVSLDGAGMRVAGGAPLSDFDGRVTRAGSVGVFDRAQ